MQPLRDHGHLWAKVSVIIIIIIIIIVVVILSAFSVYFCRAWYNLVVLGVIFLSGTYIGMKKCF